MKLTEEETRELQTLVEKAADTLYPSFDDVLVMGTIRLGEGKWAPFWAGRGPLATKASDKLLFMLMHDGY